MSAIILLPFHIKRRKRNEDFVTVFNGTTDKILYEHCKNGEHWWKRKFKTKNKISTYKNGKLHSLNGEPSVVDKWRYRYTIKRQWHRNGLLHREDGPAVEVETKRWLADDVHITRTYYKNGVLYRIEKFVKEQDGMALECKFFKNKMLHRNDGPAEILISRDSNDEMLESKEWYYNNIKVWGCHNERFKTLAGFWPSFLKKYQQDKRTSAYYHPHIRANNMRFKYLY